MFDLEGWEFNVSKSPNWGKDSSLKNNLIQ